MCCRTVFCDYFICVTIPISLSCFLKPFSFVPGAPVTKGFISYCFYFSRQILVVYSFYSNSYVSALLSHGYAKSIIWQLFLLFSSKKASAFLS